MYNDSASFGLSIVGAVELGESDYSFYILVVFKDNADGYYLGTDRVVLVLLFLRTIMI